LRADQDLNGTAVQLRARSDKMDTIPAFALVDAQI
jgi:hypothetical protein